MVTYGGPAGEYESAASRPDTVRRDRAPAVGHALFREASRPDRLRFEAPDTVRPLNVGGTVQR